MKIKNNHMVNIDFEADCIFACRWFVFLSFLIQKEQGEILKHKPEYRLQLTNFEYYDM